MADTVFKDWLQPRFVVGQPMRMIGLLMSYDLKELHRIPQQWLQFQQRLEHIQGVVDPALFGVCYPTKSGRNGVDYFTAVMVDERAIIPDGMAERRTPVCSYALFEHVGDIQGLRATLESIFRHSLPQLGYQPLGHCLHTEVYGETFDSLTGSGKIEIWVPLGMKDKGVQLKSTGED